MFHSNVHSQPYTLASLVSSAWQLASNTAMSLIHIQPTEDAVVSRDSNAAVAGEKVFPSSAPVHVRKNNRQKKDVVDLQESAPNSMSPPRAIPVMSDAASSEPVEVVCETDTSEIKKRRRGGRRRNTKKGEADQAETVTAGVVEGSNNEVDNGDAQNQQEKKESRRKRNNNKNRKEKELLGDVDIQGDNISEQPVTEEIVEQKPKQQRQQQRNAKKTNTEKNDLVEVIGVTETTPEIENVPESPEQLEEGVPTQTKGNRRRQRQRENKKKGKQALQQQPQEQLQGDVEEQTGDFEEKVEAATPVPSPTPSPSQSPSAANESEKQPKKKKKQNNNNNNNKKSKQQKQPPSPKQDEPHTGVYKNSVLKHLFLKQHGTDSLLDITTAHEVAIKPIRQPRGPTAIGERGFSADYRNSRTVKA